MLEPQLIAAARLYDEIIATNGFGTQRYEDGGTTILERMPHLRWMCGEIIRYANEGQLSRANRWVGYIQGQLQAMGMLTLDELRQHVRDQIQEDK